MSIPRIDLSRAADAGYRAILLRYLRHALLEVGFLYIEKHGVPDHLVGELVNILPVLFDIPADTKQQCALINSPHFLGYSKFGAETTANIQDQREQFEFANELHDVYSEALIRGIEAPLYLKLQGPNQWPCSDMIPNIRATVEEYIASMQDLAYRFLSLVTEALDLPATSLEKFTGPQDRLKLVHYRPAPTSVHGEHSQGVGPHKDSSGWMTFLLQASDPSIKGLQVLSKEGTWIDVPAIPGTLVVNMGQAFEVVTNGVCKATTHRVLLPPGEYDRYSVPFFQGVRPDLTKNNLKRLWAHFNPDKWKTRESEEGQRIDSPFLRGRYDTWGMSQLRTKIRSHRDVGQKHYPEIFDECVDDA